VIPLPVAVPADVHFELFAAVVRPENRLRSGFTHIKANEAHVHSQRRPQKLTPSAGQTPCPLTMETKKAHIESQLHSHLFWKIVWRQALGECLNVFQCLNPVFQSTQQAVAPEM
jgi:hypothetical protein